MVKIVKTVLLGSLIFLCFSGMPLFSQTNTQWVILIREVVNMSPGKKNQYITEAIKEISKNEINTNGLFEYAEESELEWTGQKIPEARFYSLCKKNNVRYLLDAYYYSDEKSITLTLKITSVAREKVIAQEQRTFTIDENVFYHTQSLCIRLLNSLQKITGEDTDIKKEPKDPFTKENIKFISRYEDEFLINMSLSFNYTLISSGNIHLNIVRRYNIDSPINKNIHTFSPRVSFELYKSFNQHYLGGGLVIKAPIPLKEPGFGTSSYMRFYGAFGYNKNYFFKWSFDVMSLNYNKYAKDIDEDPVSAKVLYFGFGFDVTYSPVIMPFFLKGGISIFPPLIPFVANDSKTSESYPFLITLGNKITYNSFMVPLVGRLGAGFFFTNTIGIELNYELAFLYLHHNVVINDSGTNYYKYLGRELGGVHSISLGVVYRAVIK